MADTIFLPRELLPIDSYTLFLGFVLPLLLEAFFEDIEGMFFVLA